MRISRNRMVTIALALAGGAVTALGTAGCGQNPDSRVQQSIESARIAQMKGGPEAFAQSQQLLSKAAADSDSSTATRAHVKSLLAHAEMDSATQLISDPMAGIDRGNREMARLLWEIGELGQEVRASNGLISADAQFKPAEAQEAVQKQIAAASGGAGDTVWIGKAPAAIPSQSAAKEKVSQLQDQVNAQQQKIAQLQSDQQKLAQQADQQSQHAETLSGQQGLAAFKQASALTKQAADAATRINVEKFALTRLEQDLAAAQAVQQSVDNAVAQFQKFAQQLDEGWKKIEGTIGQQQQLAAQIVSGTDAAAPAIARKADELARQEAENKKAFDQAEQSLNHAITHFQEAQRSAGDLSREYSQAMANLPHDNQVRQSMEQLVEIYNPSSFKLGEANATLALAQLQANRAQVLTEWGALLAQLQDDVKAGGVSLPDKLSDSSVSDVKKLIQQADQNFEGAASLFNDVGESTAAPSDKNAGRAGRIYALYGRSLLGRASGDAKAHQYLADAIAQRDLVLQDDKAALGALPAELVPAAAPAATSAPAPAPAATSAPATSSAAPAPAK